MDFEKIVERLNKLLEAGRHGEMRGALMMLNEVDIAQYMQQLDREKLLLVFRILPKDLSADVFSYMDADQRQTLIESIGDNEIRSLIDNMFLDDTVDFLEELPAGVVKRVLQNTDEKTRNLINRFLQYPEYSAGSLMTIEYAEFHTGTSVGKAMNILRKTGVDKETIYTLYIIDASRKLLGTLALRTMILAKDDSLLDDLMNANIVSVMTTDDQEKVADIVRRYDLMSIPVVDKENRLVGIITADDIMDVIEEENTEDFEKMGALLPAQEEYLKTSTFQLARNRIPWLLVLMISATFTGQIIAGFESVLAVNVILTTCIPMLMDTGGNCGAQASTLMIRGIALGEIQFKNILQVLWKELRVGLMIGAVLALVTFLRLLLLNHATALIAAMVAVSLYCTVLLAKGIGCTLPLLAKRCGLDPALMASPLITTLVDAASLTIYFTIASRFIL